MKLAFALLVAASSTLATGQEQAPPRSVEEVISKVNEANSSLNSWSAKFLERRHFVHFNETETKTGQIKLKRGVGLRLDIAEPDEETIVVAGDEARQWRPRTRQLHIYPLRSNPDGPSGISPVPFSFGGDWNPEKDHTVRLIDSSDDRIALELVPKEANNAYVRKILWIDPDTWLPGKLQLVEATDDIVNFVFSEIQLDTELDDGLFQLKEPKGADVVRHENLPSF